MIWFVWFLFVALTNDVSNGKLKRGLTAISLNVSALAHLWYGTTLLRKCTMAHPLVRSVVALLLVSLVTSEISSSENGAMRRAEETFEYNDLSGFSVRFERCQYVKSFDDELAEENAASVLALKHFVVYKLCPSDECSTCSGVHGDYVVDLEDYLQSTVEHAEEALQYLCDNCNYNSGSDGCGTVCYQYDNLEANGYVDAAAYIECQQVDVQNDDDANNQQLYIGPRCSQDGSEILIGLFMDEDCLEPYYDQEVEDVLGMKLSYHILANVQSNDDSLCMSCKEDDGDQNENDAGDYDDVNEMCENIYQTSGKCESIYGLDGGFVQMNRQDGGYENQVENEFMVCTFIDSLIFNSYTETGEINIVDEQDVVIRESTPLQIGVLSFLVFTWSALAAYGYILNKQILKATAKVELSSRADGELT
jgi:hypothetical protein